MAARKKSQREAALARAKSLSPERRREIASVAADKRWDKIRGIPKETHSGVLKLGDGIPCSVLSNGMRVFSVNGLGRAFGSGQKGRSGEGEERLPAFLSAANIRPFIAPPLMQKLTEPVQFRAKNGGALAYGYEAGLLNRICSVLLDARAAGTLRQPQLAAAAAAELLMRGFAEVGLVALIDEATGFQAERARDELHKILEAYISRELLPWTKKFPDEFFEQIYRIHGWRYDVGNSQRPGYVGKFINRYVYEPLPEGVLNELKKRNPPINGRRRHKHFQLLTEHTGNPHLDKQIVAVTTAMRLSDGKSDFHTKFQRLYPQRGDQGELEFTDGSEQIEIIDVDVLEGSASEKAMAFLRSGNAVSSRDLSEAVYGNSKEATRNKLRKLMDRLRKEGLVETPSPGIWRKSSRT